MSRKTTKNVGKSMQLSVYLYPNYITLDTFKKESDVLMDIFAKAGFTFKAVAWDGRLETLPKKERVLVRASTMLDYEWGILDKECNRWGHILFHREIVLTNGSRKSSPADLIKIARKFIS